MDNDTAVVDKYTSLLCWFAKSYNKCDPRFVELLRLEIKQRELVEPDPGESPYVYQVLVSFEHHNYMITDVNTNRMYFVEDSRTHVGTYTFCNKTNAHEFATLVFLNLYVRPTNQFFKRCMDWYVSTPEMVKKYKKYINEKFLVIQKPDAWL